MGKNRDAGSQSEGALFLSSRQRRPGIAVRDERADQRCCGGEQKHAAVPAVQKIDGMGRQMTRDEHEAMEECAAIIQFCSGREIGRVDAWQMAQEQQIRGRGAVFVGHGISNHRQDSFDGASGDCGEMRIRREGGLLLFSGRIYLQSNPFAPAER